MSRSWVLLAFVWMSVVLPSSDSVDDISGDYTGYGSLVRVRRKAADSTQLWPDGLVPYTFLEPQPSRSIIISGLRHWETHTCIRFMPVNNTAFPHLQFRRLSGCRSGVGIEGTSGQNVSIGDNCNKLGIVVHEIGHALGFYHEIRRPDRDDHVVINENNILKDELFNFYKLHWLDISIKYDLSSVMHYNPLEWSSNERTTVATKDPMLQGVIGRWKQESDLGLSHRDKLLANTIYGCLDRWLGKCNLNRNPCKNEGYLSDTCTCICAPGTTGRTCETTIGGYYDSLKSPCSQEVSYSTYISSPNYPLNYDSDTWCVYRLKGEECQAPGIEIIDFQLGPRSHRNQCFHDYLEIRNHTLYNGFIKCGTDVARGTKWISSGSTMILYFKGSEGGYRGFKAKVEFNPIPGCCRTHTNSSAYFLHTPGYPHPYSGDFNCSYSITAEAPARVVVTVIRKSGSKTDDRWTCALQLCQPHGRCHSHCKGVIADGFSRHLPKEVILPNVASVHYLQYSGNDSPFSSENAAFQVGFTIEDSPCHRVIIVNRTEPRGWITVGPRFFELLQCEWWFQAPRGSHVKITMKDLHLPVHEDSYLAINEAGEATYPKDTTRVYHDFDHTPKTFVSLEYKLAIVLQGDFITEVSFKYELYDCVDTDDECEYWAANDECDKNPYWMKKNCKKSCAVCEYSAVCEDDHNECDFWATHEQCNENRIWMNAHCKKSCGYCDLCRDANPQCPEWAEMGDCRGNPSYMDQFCRKSCGLCGNIETATTAVKSTGKVGVTSTSHTPISTTADKDKETSRPDNHRTINQTFKLNKHKLKRHRNKSVKPSKDRFKKYKQNNVMLPPYGEENEDIDSFEVNKLDDGLSKEKNLKKPFDTGRTPKLMKKKKKKKNVTASISEEHQKPKSHRSRTSPPNTQIGNYRNKKRKYKVITESPGKNQTEDKDSVVSGDATRLVALPLTRERNESELQGKPILPLNSSEDASKTNDTQGGEILVRILSSDERVRQNESDVGCHEESNCFSPQIEHPLPDSKQISQTDNKILKINNKIFVGNPRKLNRTNISSKKIRKNKSAVKKRNRNKKKKKRCRKNRGPRKLSLPNKIVRNDTQKYIRKNSRRRSKPMNNQNERKRRRKSKPGDKGRNKGYCRGSRKQSGRHHKKTHGSGHTKSDESNQTATWSIENISTTVRNNETVDPPIVTTRLPYIPQPTSSIPLTTSEVTLEESVTTTELVEVTTTETPANNFITTPATLHSSTIMSVPRTSLASTTAATVAISTTEASSIHSTLPIDRTSPNVSKSSHYNKENNSIFSDVSLNATSPHRKRKDKHHSRLNIGRNNKKSQSQQKHKGPNLNRSSRRNGKRNQNTKQKRGQWLNKTRHRKVFPKANYTRKWNKQSRWLKRRKKQRLRKGTRDNPDPSHGLKNKVNHVKDRNYLKKHQNKSLPRQKKLYSPGGALSTASPPAPSSTSSIPSPEEMMIMRTPNTQTEVSTELHAMLKTEPEVENQIRDYGIIIPVSKTEDDKIMSTGSQEDELESDQMDGPPQRTPKKYAEWGIGPVKSPHNTGLRARPKWKYRRSFYRRDHIYEDIWPLFDGTAYGKKR
ncbi:uncharacterized protein LOC135197964 isoform X1 [Macrobrachium nipponense]|uniref:uncharacterized protein LOC135197964 isoform X1 n=2 Tax=Macrobrachium nipponense TaxID=159736 RepID=UPI0030C834D7